MAPLFKLMRPNQALDRVIPFFRRYGRLLAVGLFLGVLLGVFEVSGLRDHFNLSFIRQLILQHRIGGVMLFVLLFSLGNLIQIPGWVFLAAAVAAPTEPCRSSGASGSSASVRHRRGGVVVLKTLLWRFALPTIPALGSARSVRHRAHPRQNRLRSS